MKKLFRVTCQGMQGSPHHHGVGYVIADDATQAYEKLNRELTQRQLGFESDREMHAVELIAECAEYPRVGYALYFA